LEFIGDAIMYATAYAVVVNLGLFVVVYSSYKVTVIMVAARLARASREDSAYASDMPAAA
jgi:hypothetical protein